MIIDDIRVEKKFKYIWLKTVKDVDLTHHCAKCLIGDYDSRISKNTKHEINIKLKDDCIYYLCGVSFPYVWKNNFHLAFIHCENSTIELNENGIYIKITGAKELPITTDYIDTNNEYRTKKEFYTCRNWQFANYFDKVIKKKEV